MVTQVTTEQAVIAQPTVQPEIKHCGDATYLVKGRSDWYLVDAEKATCECDDWVHRRAHKHDMCRHLVMLAEHLACPVCKGRGEHGPVSDNGLVWLDKETIPCIVCSGTGRRAHVEEKPAPEISEEELKRLLA